MESPLEFKKLTDKFRGFDKLNLAVALVDISFKVIHHNNGFLRQFQSTEETGSMARLDQIFSNFDQKLDALKQAGLLSGHLLNFVIPGVKQRNIERYYDLQVSRLDPEVDLFEGFSISFIDVSDRERELVKLRETSEHHEKFIKYTTSGVMIHRDGKIVYVNDQGLKMIRATSAEDLIGRNVMDFVSEGFKTIAMERIRQMTETNKPVEPIEEIFIREDKTTFTGEIFAYPVHFQGLPAIKVIINDVSGRKEAEDRLRKSEKKYATLVNHVQDVIFQTDKDAKITFLSDAWFDLTGFEVQDAIGKSILDFLEETDSKSTELYTRIRRLLMLGIATHERDLKIKTAEEGSKYIQVKFSAIYNDEHSIVGISGMIIDIHARKSAELELQKLENSLRKQQRIYLKLAKSQVLNGDDFNAAIRLIAQTSAGVMHLDRVNIWRMNKEDGSLVCLCNFDETTKSFSGEGETIYNFHNYLKMVQEERVLNADDALTDPRMSEFLDSYIIPSGIKSMMDAGIFIGDDMWGFICFDMVESKRHWSVEDRTFASNLADMISIAWVKSEKKATTEALNKSEQLNSTLLNNAGDAILLISPEGIIEQVNKMACVLSGYQREELIGAFMNGFIPERFRKDGFLGIEGFTSGTPVNKNRFINTSDGGERLMEVTATRLEDGKVLTILRDITERSEQQKALKESETRLDLALKGADLGTWDYYIKEDRIIHNRRWAEMLGYNFEITTVNEQFWEKFVHPADIEPANIAFDKHIRGETPRYEATIRMLSSSGEWRWILDKGKIVEWDENGEPVRASGIHQDVTALKSYEKEIKNQRLFLQQIINAIPYPLYVKNINEEFVLINNSFAEFLGVERQEVLQYKFNKKTAFDDTKLKLFEPDYEIYLTRKPMHFSEHELINSTTEKRHWLQTIKVPLHDSDGNLYEILSVSTDITEVKERELRLIAGREVMENKLSARTSMLEQSNNEIETFNYSVSHDLRTPLRTIDIFAYFLEKNYADKLDEEGKENIQQIRSSITKMTTLIDNLLIYIRMGKIEVKKESIALRELLDEVIREVGKISDIRNVEFKFEEMPPVKADWMMLKQGLFNLLSNAVKFTSTRKAPQVIIRGAVENGFSIIQIKDNGVGFSMEYKDKLFKAFKRLHSEEHFEGTGVGLAIVEKIISRHKGQIWAESVLNTSTTFFIKLPID